MSDVHHRDAILDGLRYGARSAAQLFNGIPSCESLPDLMRDLRAMVELRELQVLRLGTMLMYAVSGETPNAAPPPDLAPQPETPPEPVALRPVAEVVKVRAQKPPRTPVQRPGARQRLDGKPSRGRRLDPDCDAGNLVKVIGQHPWRSLAELAALSGMQPRGRANASELMASALCYLLRKGRVQRTGRKGAYRYALPDCTVSPPPAIEPGVPTRSERAAVRANQPPRTAPSLRHTLDGMLVELNRLGEVRLVSSGHARLNWMCWLMPANGVMVSSSWRNDAREAVADLVARLEQLRGRLLTERTEPQPDQAPARAA